MYVEAKETTLRAGRCYYTNAQNTNNGGNIWNVKNGGISNVALR